VLINRKLADTVKSYQDLNDPRYTVTSKLGTSGDIASRKFMPKARLKAFETEADAAMEVRQGRADAFVYDLPFNVVYAAQAGDKLVHLKDPFTQEALGWAVRKGDPDFINWLNNFLAQIRRDEIYDALYKRWFENAAWLQSVN